MVHAPTLNKDSMATNTGKKARRKDEHYEHCESFKEVNVVIQFLRLESFLISYKNLFLDILPILKSLYNC